MERSGLPRNALGQQLGLSASSISLLLRQKLPSTSNAYDKVYRFLYEQDQEYVSQVRRAMARSQTTLKMLAQLIFDSETQEDELVKWMSFEVPLDERIALDDSISRWLQKQSGINKPKKSEAPAKRPQKAAAASEDEDEPEVKKPSKKNALPKRDATVNGPKGKSNLAFKEDRWKVKWAQLTFHEVELKAFIAPGYDVLRVGCHGQNLELRAFSALREPPTQNKQSEKEKELGCKGWLLNAGGSVGALEWVPVGNPATEPHRCKQYLAVCANLNKYHLMAAHHQGTNMIQIWSFGVLGEAKASSTPFLALGLLHEGAIVWDLAWVNGAYEKESGKDKEASRLGILAASFGDGTIRVFSVPHPSGEQASFLRVDELPGVQLAVACSGSPSSLALCWSPFTPLLAAGTVKGTFAIWDLQTVSEPRLLPMFYGMGHTSEYPVRCISFCPYNANLLITSAQDGFIHLWDMRDFFEPVFSHKSGLEPVLNLFWVPEHQYHIAFTVRSQFRMLAVGGKTVNRGNTFRPTNTLPLPDHITPWCVATCASPDGILCIAIAQSDGQVNLVSTATNSLMGKKELSTSSRGLSVTQIEYAVDMKSEQPPEAVEGPRSPGILFSSGYPLEACSSNAQALVKRRVKLDTRTQTPAQLSLDDWTAVLKVKFNPNFFFPRVVASGGLSGVVRCQLVTDL